MVLWTILAWVGRIGFAAFFIMSGVNHFKNAKGITGYAQSKGVPGAAVGVPVSGAMLIAGGVLILFSWHAIIGVALLVLFLLPAAFMIHNYWTESDPMMKANQHAHFWKNIALAAAAVLVAVAHHRGAGEGVLLLAPEQQAHDTGAGADDGERRGRPEGEHTPREPRLELREALGQPGLVLVPPHVPFRVGLRQPLFQLRVELTPPRAPLRVQLDEPLVQLRVEGTPPGAPLRVKLDEPLFQLHIELTPPRAPLRVQLDEPLFEFGVEPREVDLVEVAQVGPIGGIHGVEPVHELVRDVLTHLLIELLGQFRGDHSPFLRVSSPRCNPER